MACKNCSCIPVNTEKGFLDRVVEKAISRKFLAWITATGLLAFADLTSTDWVTITAIFIGSQAAVDAVAKLRS
jgi:hypothetical protein|tara:strand:+ start:1281 stop:1499 length:219 start_codon:yes stop_codon:yes gene_type:complete